jgi:acyl carrier protein
MQNRAQIADRVRAVLAEVLDVPAAGIGQGFSAASVASWNSLNHLMMVSQLETEFGVIFSNEEMQALNSFDAIVELLGRRLDSVA